MNGRIILAADRVWLGGDEAVPDMAVLLEDGRIADVLPASDVPMDPAVARVRRCDLLLPGLINAHCHLEYTWMRGRLPDGGDTDFAGWLEAIRPLKAEVTPEEKRAEIRRGIGDLIAGGATCVVDSYEDVASVEELAGSPLRYVALAEMIHLAPGADAVPPALPPAGGVPRGPRCLGVGANPHAPYTINGTARRLLASALAAHPALPCAWHIAETADEVEMFECGSGAMMDFFVRNGVPLPFDEPPRCHPADFLRAAGLLDRCDAAFHWNVPPAGGSAHFAAPRAVVHCPGTHAFFMRPPFPMREVLADGANVCLGTDSLASGGSLSMLEMIRLAADAFPFLGGRGLLEMATRNPARSRMISGSGLRLGEIAQGAEADLVHLAIPQGAAGMGLRDLLVHRDTRVAAVMIAGEWVL